MRKNAITKVGHIDRAFRRWLCAATIGVLISCVLPSTGETDQVYSGPYLNGRLLVAADSMPDPRFRDTVILILEHDATGAFGVALNRPIESGPLAGLMAGFGITPPKIDEDALAKEISLRSGGPVELERVVFVHSTDYHARGSSLVGKDLAWSLEGSVLIASAAGRGPEDLLVFMGYTGWGGGQLEKEIGRGDWLDADANAFLVFQAPTEDLYRMVHDAAGLSL